MIKNIEIHNFRLFKNVNFNIGKKITVIAGKNAVGKSNLLGMLGNSAELKGFRPILHKRFRTEFSDIFKGSLDYDPSSSNKFVVNFTDESFESITDYREFRVSWQEKNTRFRIIPKKNLPNRKITEAKVVWPTLYLGLSRLFPLGEIETENIKPKTLKLTQQEEEWFIEKYKFILSMSGEEIDTISQVDIENNMRSIGINTPTYNYLSNSAGQDNIGQILCTLLSFKRLKDDPSYEYTGGLLLIDEIDATLHPLAQRNLFDVIYRFSKDNCIQTVFTTHSMSLLEFITEKTYYNTGSNASNNNIEIVYLTNDNDILEVERNPSFSFIKNELLLQSIVHRKNQIKIYVEDHEAKWFLENILSDYLGSLDIKPAKLGSQELIYLNTVDIEYFSTVIMCLDGDVNDSDILESFKNTKRPINIIKLPGDQSPEDVFYNYLLDLPSEHEFLSSVKHLNFTKKYFREKGPDLYPGDMPMREKNKKWFRDHLESFDVYQLYDYWEVDNQDLVDNFTSQFKIIFNDLAKNLRLPRI